MFEAVHALEDGRLCAVSVLLPGAPHGPDVTRLVSLACRTFGRLPASCNGVEAVLLAPRLRSAADCGPALVEEVAAALADAAGAARLIDLGFSEELLASAGTDTLLALSALRDMEVGVAINGLRLGPHSLALLGRLPVTGVRLHPGIARALPQERAIRGQLAELIRAAHDQDAAVLATGVERALQRDILGDLSCDHALGPLFGRPMTAAAFLGGIGGGGIGGEWHRGGVA